MACAQAIHETVAPIRAEIAQVEWQAGLAARGHLYEFMHGTSACARHKLIMMVVT